MIEIINPSAYFVAGIALYAFIIHIQVGLRHPADPKHILFALMCLFACSYIPINARALLATSIDDFVNAFKWTHTFISFYVLSMIWFIAEYSKCRPKLMLITFSGLTLLTMVVNILGPLGLQFEDISGLKLVSLPWGEQLTIVKGKVSYWFLFAFSLLVFELGYMIYAVMQTVITRKTPHNLAMFFAVLFYGATFIEGLLVRMDYLKFMPLGYLGCLGFIMVMSMILNQEYNDERKAATATIEREHQRLETLLKTASDGIHILNDEGLLIEANDAFLQMLGLDRGVLGVMYVNNWDAYFDRETRRQTIEAIFSSNNTQVFETQHRSSDGRIIDVEVSVNRVILDGKRYLYCASRDITERKSYQAELERRVKARTAELAVAKEEAESANAVKTRFMTNLSHEMLTPLNGILGFANLGLIKASKVSANEFMSYFEKIALSGNKLNELVQSLLNLVQLSANAHNSLSSEGLKPISLEDVVSLSVNNMQKTALLRQQKIEYENLALASTVSGDARQLQQVIENLLDNALRYSTDQSTVRVQLINNLNNNDSQLITVQVIDEGCGIPEKEIKAIFEPFYQSSRTATGAGGTGLGLVLCKNIIKRHFGNLIALNRPEGGAIFEISLPTMS